MTLLWAGLVVVAFTVTIERLGLPARGREVARRARSCLGVLRDPSLDDEAKEERLQRQAVRLFGLLGVLLGGGLLALALPLGGVWLLDVAGWASVSAVLGTLERPDVLAGAAALGGLVHLALRRLGAS